MTDIKLFLLVLLLHFIADFNLQLGAGLDKFKSVDWWRKIMGETIWGTADEQFRKYKHDYKVAMAIHSVVWALVTFAPCIWLCTSAKAMLSILAVNAVAHYYIDNLKANRYRLNLVQDQILHLLQVGASFFAFRLCGGTI